MAEKDQAKPLAPATDRLSSDEDEAMLLSKKLRRRKYIKCCGCIMALIVIPAVTIIVLIVTVFRVKDPIIKMNGVKVEQFELVNGTIPAPGMNMTLIADVSVKNPNVASFKFGNTTTTLYYHGTVVGEARNPPGQAKARRTLRMNVTIEIIPDRLLANPNLKTDLVSQMLTMSTYTRTGGRVRILKIIKKHVIVKMNCTISVNIMTQEIQEQKCKRHVKI